MKTYAVFDTNVLVSAMITHNPDAPTVKVIEAMALKKIVPLYNEEIVGEYDNVLHRDKFNLLDEDVANMIGSILKNGLNVDRTESGLEFADATDAVFYEVALSKEGSFVITGNAKHFPKTPFVVSPAEMLQILQES